MHHAHQHVPRRWKAHDDSDDSSETEEWAMMGSKRTLRYGADAGAELGNFLQAERNRQSATVASSAIGFAGVIRQRLVNFSFSPASRQIFMFFSSFRNS